MSFCNFSIGKNNFTNEITIGNWIVHTEKKNNKNICYIYSHPVKNKFIIEDRKNTYININYLEKNKFNITIFPGYKTSKSLPLTITINGKSLNLTRLNSDFFTTYDSSQDEYIVNLLVNNTNSYFYVESFKNKNTVTFDYYSASGLRDALISVKNNCK